MKRKKTIVYKLDSKTKEKQVAAILEFSAAGKETLQQYFQNDGETVNEESKFTYDDAGNLIQTKVSNSAGESQQADRTYDSQNRLIEEKVFVDEVLEQHKTVQWADDSLSSRTTYYDADGNMSNVVDTLYLDKDVLQREAIYDEEEQLIEAYDYEYENGNLVKKIGDFGGFSTEEHYKYTFDDNGNITSKQKEDDEGDTETQEIEYHSNGKKAKQHVTLVSGIQEIAKYDEQERVIQVLRIDVTGYNSFESQSKYTEDHDYMTEKVIRNDESVTQFFYEHEFHEAKENA